MQLQSVPGEPFRPFDPSPASPETTPHPTRALDDALNPADAAAAALAARGIVLVSGRLTEETVNRVMAHALTSDTGRPLEVHLTNTTGSLRRALLLHDLLAGLAPRPHMVASGQLDTAGAIVLAAAADGERSLTAHASIHLTRIDGRGIADDDNELAHLQLDLESAAAEAAAIKAHAEEILGRTLDAPALYRAEEAVAEHLADKIR